MRVCLRISQRLISRNPDTYRFRKILRTLNDWCLCICEWWLMPMIPVWERLRQGFHEFNPASLQTKPNEQTSPRNLCPWRRLKEQPLFVLVKRNSGRTKGWFWTGAALSSMPRQDPQQPPGSLQEMPALVLLPHVLSEKLFVGPSGQCLAVLQGHCRAQRWCGKQWWWDSELYWPLEGERKLHGSDNAYTSSS